MNDLTDDEKKALLLNPTWYTYCTADVHVNKPSNGSASEYLTTITEKLDLKKMLMQIYKENFLYGEAFPFIDNSKHQMAILKADELHEDFEKKKALMYYPGDGSRWSDL